MLSIMKRNITDKNNDEIDVNLLRTIPKDVIISTIIPAMLEETNNKLAIAEQKLKMVNVLRADLYEPAICINCCFDGCNEFVMKVYNRHDSMCVFSSTPTECIHAYETLMCGYDYGYRRYGTYGYFCRHDATKGRWLCSKHSNAEHFQLGNDADANICPFEVNADYNVVCKNGQHI